MGIKGKAKNEKESTAGCLIDKIGAIVDERGVREFVNDLQVDLAACCTKDKADCMGDVWEAYGLLTAVNLKEAKPEDVEAQVAAHLIHAVVKRVHIDRVKVSHAKYLNMCRGPAEKCTIEELKGRGSISA